MVRDEQLVLWFDELSIDDIPLVGGKNASLGEMYRTLTPKGVRIPNGFAVTAAAYRFFLYKAGIGDQMKSILKGLDVHNMRQLAERGRKVRELIQHAEFPDELREAIEASYHELCKEYGANTDVAVRSSATAEDLPDASFAGQQETFLNIRGVDDLMEACRRCFASLFTNRAIAYREEKKFDHFKVYLSIGVQKMVRSDRACSGVLFTLDTETGFPDVVFVTSSYGLGENIVQGAVNPDEFFVHKPTLKQGYKPIIKKVLGEKSIKMIYADEGTKTTKNVDTSINDRKRFSLTDDEVLELANWGCIIEDHYTNKRKHWSPMDIEWAKDGLTDKLFIVQARPETVQSRKNKSIIEEYVLKQKGTLLCHGKSVGNKIAASIAQVIKDAKDIERFTPGNILVTEMTDPDWVPIMRVAKAIVTNRGGRTCFTGDTKILTEYGFMTMKELYDRGDGLCVPSLNRETMKIEWKSVLAVMKKRAQIIEVATSLTGRQSNNTLRLTPDHKMIGIAGRELVDKEIGAIIADQEHLVVAQRLPALSQSTKQEQEMAYLVGAVSTDGHVHLTSRHGEVTFVQKPTPQKEEFIATVIKHMHAASGKNPLIREKPMSQGMIRGKLVQGSANSYRWFGKQIAEELTIQQKQLIPTLLVADEPLAYQFLAGVIDGDGTYNAKAHRVSIYVSKTWLLEAVIVACLRVGIVPQVSHNRTVANVQIVEKLDIIGRYTKRIKPCGRRIRIGTRFFSAKQVIGDIIGHVNAKGQLKPYVSNNLLMSVDCIAENVLPLASQQERAQLQRLLDGDIRQQRVSLSRELGEQDVYNISVAGNHNYIVFSDAYTPILVNNCHAAIISRELGIPCVVGTNDATEKIKPGQKVTVSCAEGEDGNVYAGLLKFEKHVTDASRLAKPKTKIMMNVGNPDEAFELSFIPNDGVGLAREEFIINNSIKIHPMALLHFNKLDANVKAQIELLTRGYSDKAQFFVDKLAEGVATIAAAFYPKDVIVRMSDFKSNEYAGLIGGAQFEPKEDNPMIGWRGASRYYKPGYEEGFALECKAMKKVRDEMGLTNVKLMIPFCRTITEGRNVLSVMAKHGLVRHKHGLEVYVMCEIPSNVILAERFGELFDGFSIGSNDLTQLTLGVDRDSALVADVYDERNDAVKELIAHVIAVCKKMKRKIGICGQAPSDYPEFAQFLVKHGIDSISLNPDSVMRTIPKILQMERR